MPRHWLGRGSCLFIWSPLSPWILEERLVETSSLCKASCSSSLKTTRPFMAARKMPKRLLDMSWRYDKLIQPLTVSQGLTSYWMTYVDGLHFPMMTVLHYLGFCVTAVHFFHSCDLPSSADDTVTHWKRNFVCMYMWLFEFDMLSMVLTMVVLLFILMTLNWMRYIVSAFFFVLTLVSAHETSWWEFEPSWTLRRVRQGIVIWPRRSWRTFGTWWKLLRVRLR